MDKKKGQQDHESIMLEDLVKILSRYFDLKVEDKTSVPRGDFYYDEVIQLQGVIQEPLPQALQIFRNKKTLICEVKTPGKYMDFPVLTQMTHYQGACLTEILREKNDPPGNRELKWKKLDERVLLTVVNKFSKSMKERLKKYGLCLEPVEAGIYKVSMLAHHYLFVIDELPIDLWVLELLKYSEDSDRIQEFLQWVRDHMKKEEQKEVASSLIEVNPKLKKEVEKMIPVSSDPQVNREYIDGVFEGFGVEPIIDHALEKYKEKIMQRLVESGVTQEEILEQWGKGKK